MIIRCYGSLMVSLSIPISRFELNALFSVFSFLLNVIWARTVDLTAIFISAIFKKFGSTHILVESSCVRSEKFVPKRTTANIFY